MARLDKTIIAIALCVCSAHGFADDKTASGNKNSVIRSGAIQSMPVTNERYFYYLGNHPANASPRWHEDVQGITHDDDHWYITQSDTGDANEQALWKIPVGHNLKDSALNKPNVKRVVLNTIPQLKEYDHFGALAYYKYNNTGYLIAPLTGKAAPALAIFDANTLRYVTHSTNLPMLARASWVAVDPQGFVYLSMSLGGGGGIGGNDGSRGRERQKSISTADDMSIPSLVQCTVDWNLLYQRQYLSIEPVKRIALYDERGKNMLPKKHPQGGVFSPSGKLFYFVSGYIGADRDDGIHVFDTTTWKRIKKSTNGSGEFNYEFRTSAWYDLTIDGDEPEGLTIWDLDDGRAPGIRGQLHVLMLNNNAGQDQVHLKHYSYKKPTIPPRQPPTPRECPSGYICCGTTLPDGRCDSGKCVKPTQRCR